MTGEEDTGFSYKNLGLKLRLKQQFLLRTLLVHMQCFNVVYIGCYINVGDSKQSQIIVDWRFHLFKSLNVVEFYIFVLKNII